MMINDVENSLNLTSDLAENQLKEFALSFESVMLASLPKSSGREGRVVDAMKYALLAGGKRIRPFLIVQSASLFNVAEETALKIAVAVEYVHTYSLIHDDLPAMDDDDLRRGKPSTHKKFDEATAILAGDALLTLSSEILAQETTHADPLVRLNLITGLSKAIGTQGMVGGQMFDIVSENEILNEEEIISLQRMKTGALIEFSCDAGAISANISGDKADALKKYARNIGLCFQIVDDLLDLKGSSEVIGKTAGKDAEAGKATLISLLGEKKARNYADKLIEESLKALTIFGKEADILRSLALFVIGRVS